MTPKAVKGIIRRKIADWIENIHDQPLREHIADKIVVTGGSIASLLTDQKVNDFDVYFKDRETVIKVCQYYLARFAKNPPPKFARGDSTQITLITTPERVKIKVQSVGVAGEEGDGATYEYFESASPDRATEYVDKVVPLEEGEESMVLDEDSTPLPNPADDKQINTFKDVTDQINAPPMKGEAKAENKYRPVFISANAITLANDIQLCIRFWGSPDELHKNFDFVHCTNYYDSGTGELVLKPEAVLSLLTKDLRYVGSLFPICSVIRTRKFIRRGWKVNAGQFIKMCHQISKLNMDDVNVLEEQLTGVDAAYFAEIIAILKNDVKNGKTIDQAYIVELIDRLF